MQEALSQHKEIFVVVLSQLQSSNMSVGNNSASINSFSEVEPQKNNNKVSGNHQEKYFFDLKNKKKISQLHHIAKKLETYVGVFLVCWLPLEMFIASFCVVWCLILYSTPFFMHYLKVTVSEIKCQ